MEFLERFLLIESVSKRNHLLWYTTSHSKGNFYLMPWKMRCYATNTNFSVIVDRFGRASAPS